MAEKDNPHLDFKLGWNQQRDLLRELLNFEIDEENVIYDEDGNEFYGFNANDKYDLSTLRGIVFYMTDQAFINGQEKGRREIQTGIKRLLEF